MKHLKYFGDFVNELSKSKIAEEEDLVKKNIEESPEGEDDDSPEGEEEKKDDAPKVDPVVDLDLDIEGDDEKKEEEPEEEDDEDDEASGTPTEDTGK